MESEMKRMKIFLIPFLLLAQLTFAQTAFYSKTADVTHFAVVFPNTNIDSLTSIYSEWFTLAGYETTEPYVLQTDTSGALAQTYYPDKIFGSYKFSSTIAKPKLTLIVQGTMDVTDTTQHFAVDTLSAVADSSEIWTYFTSDFNGKRFLNYRLYFKTAAGNPSDVYAKAAFYKPKKKLQ